jgi:ceramide glucosyltransferase
MTTLTFLAGSFCALAAVLHLTSIVVVIARHRKPDACVGSPEQAEGVTIVRPVCGVENFSHETLASAFHLDYPSYEIIFCAAHVGDPVLLLVQRLIAAHPNVPARVLVGNDQISTNPKLNNTVKGWEAARHEWIVMADSNVLMPLFRSRNLRGRDSPAPRLRGLCCGDGLADYERLGGLCIRLVSRRGGPGL